MEKFSTLVGLLLATTPFLGFASPLRLVLNLDQARQDYTVTLDENRNNARTDSQSDNRISLTSEDDSCISHTSHEWVSLEASEDMSFMEDAVAMLKLEDKRKDLRGKTIIGIHVVDLDTVNGRLHKTSEEQDREATRKIVRQMTLERKCLDPRSRLSTLRAMEEAKREVAPLQVSGVKKNDDYIKNLLPKIKEKSQARDAKRKAALDKMASNIQLWLTVDGRGPLE